MENNKEKFVQKILNSIFQVRRIIGDSLFSLVYFFFFYEKNHWKSKKDCFHSNSPFNDKMIVNLE